LRIEEAENRNETWRVEASTGGHYNSQNSVELIPSKERAKEKETENTIEGQKRRVIMSRGRW